MTRRKDPREARLPVPSGELPQFTPVPSQTNRHDGWTPQRQRDFIDALADTGSVDAACKAVNMSTVGAYRIRRLPEGESFRDAWDAALALGVRRLEDVAMERALNGVDVPVYSYGKLVGLRKSYNDRLLMFMLRNRAPERFADGRAKGMSGMDLTRLEQEKKKWRKEWELEQQAKRPNVSPADLRASIERKVERLREQVEAKRQREWEALSEETCEAWERFEALKARDLDALNASAARLSLQPAHPEPVEGSAHPEPVEGPEPDEPETGPKVRRLKDEGWD